MKKSLYLLLLLLFPIGLQAQSEVIVLHPDEGKAEVNEAEYTIPSPVHHYLRHHPYW